VSVEDMLANAKAAAASSSSSGSKSTIQQMLEGRDPSDTVELSPVAKLLAAKTTATTKESYFDSDEYITSKVAQLKGQLALYTTLPGLDPGGGVIDSITTEVNKLVKQQQDKLKESTDAADAKQKELDEQNKNAYQGISSDAMLNRSKQVATTGKVADSTDVSADVQKMLDKVKGSTVNTTA
jgi:hypothetical protein